jgi:hypothetical protein
LELTGFSGSTIQGKVGCLTGGSLEPLVAEASVSAPGHNEALSLLGEIHQRFIVGVGCPIPDDGSERQMDFKGLSPGPCTPVGSTVLPAPSAKGASVLEFKKSAQVSVCHKNNVATVATIAPIGAAEGDKFFTPEADKAVSACSRLYGDQSFVNESLSALHEFAPYAETARRINDSRMLDEASSCPERCSGEGLLAGDSERPVHSPRSTCASLRPFDSS